LRLFRKMFEGHARFENLQDGANGGG